MQYLQFAIDLDGREKSHFGPYVFRDKQEMYQWIWRFEDEIFALERKLARYALKIKPEYDIRELSNFREALKAPPPTEIIANIRIILKQRYKLNAA